jgi:ferric-dicitrate binding protein FerR (iron transport regulator)
MMPFGKRQVVLFIFLIAAFVSYAQAQPVIAKAILIQNTVTIESPKLNPIKIKRGSVLSLSDTIRTGENARAIFRFNDGTLLTLGSNSEIKIQTFTVTTEHKKGVFEFVKGALRIVTGAITKTDTPHFNVNTPMGSIGIRGTDFWGGNLSDDGSVDVLLIKSEHSLEVKNQFGSVLLQQDNQGSTLKPNQAPLSARMWPQEKIQRALDSIATP